MFKADCRHETLQQLHLALKKAGLVDLHFPYELATAPVSVMVDRVSLDRLLQTALSSYSYIVSDSDEDTSSMTRVTVVGLRDVLSGDTPLYSHTHNFALPDLPGPIPPPIVLIPSTEVIDSGNTVPAGPTPGPDVKVLGSNLQPSESVSVHEVAQSNGAGDIPSKIPTSITTPSELLPIQGEAILPTAAFEQPN